MKLGRDVGHQAQPRRKYELEKDQRRTVHPFSCLYKAFPFPSLHIGNLGVLLCFAIQIGRTKKEQIPNPTAFSFFSIRDLSC